VGSININGSARAVFSQYTPYTGVDIVPGPCVDEVVDIRDLSAAKAAELSIYNLIVSTEVLEHTQPEPLLDAMLNLANPNGCTMVITCAGPTRRPHSADGAPDVKRGEYYANVSVSQLYDWLESIEDKGWYTEWEFIQTNQDKSDVYGAWHLFNPSWSDPITMLYPEKPPI
jgi:hypothetical protein